MKSKNMKKIIFSIAFAIYLIFTTIVTMVIFLSVVIWASYWLITKRNFFDECLFTDTSIIMKPVGYLLNRACELDKK